MHEIFVFIFLFVAVVVITTVVFGIWVTSSILRMIGRGVSSMLGLPGGRVSSATNGCPRSACRAVNPTSARFCRRCGQELLRRPMARRAALW